MRLNLWKPKYNYRLCSKHFEEIRNSNSQVTQHCLNI
uniref:Uncharacterized protein n=1 Tax=Lepeophtheirus salmonis TaxID=72036 RepID=A0A0K2UXQ5_LEPSM